MVLINFSHGISGTIVNVTGAAKMREAIRNSLKRCQIGGWEGMSEVGEFEGGVAGELVRQIVDHVPI